MKKIIAEFKKFVMRGNIVDMAVGVIVGSSFTAIVNALSNNILKPIINYLLTLCFGANSLSEVYTFLLPPVIDAETGAIDFEQSVYIDWGAFINSIINFVLVAKARTDAFKKADISHFADANDNLSPPRFTDAYRNLRADALGRTF